VPITDISSENLQTEIWFDEYYFIWSTLEIWIINFGFADFQTVSYTKHQYRGPIYKELSQIYLLEYH
jgi:hypothetical protein